MKARSVSFTHAADDGDTKKEYLKKTIALLKGQRME